MDAGSCGQADVSYMTAVILWWGCACDCTQQDTCHRDTVLLVAFADWRPADLQPVLPFLHL